MQEKMKQYPIRLPDGMVAKITKISRRTGVPEPTVVRLALSRGLDLLDSGEYNPFAEKP